jgi:hypothetical protein
MKLYAVESEWHTAYHCQTQLYPGSPFQPVDLPLPVRTGLPGKLALGAPLP